jgi:hypothetical protein
MTLLEALRLVPSMDERGALVAVPPLTWGSEARVSNLVGDRYEVPAEAVDAGFEYVLGKEDLETLLGYATQKRMSEEAVAEFVVHFALHDAYPAWFNDIPNVQEGGV